ncbi:prolyl 4-hydroxylase subunit alpha [Fulvivirga sp. M361]|uniref:2OG-Fe(II) oxygenase n=1 Tax=Fulvivirga sp. M361 TaxID=2594266 RepID=UPI00117B5C88|nr:2OG-Fe(II) oxygenase [Fulvivirga sp. M361]TRX59903.1 prolyl 4-hydroxylase subunit alpha [Fulvivirga sp. M361]
METFTPIERSIQAQNWTSVIASIDTKGYAKLPGCIPENQCNDLIRLYDQQEHFRKTIVMERYRFGLGEYKYFKYPLPKAIQDMRELIYPNLVTLANKWVASLNLGQAFPSSLKELQDICVKNHQVKPTPLLLKYGEGGYNTLHQDLYGSIYFPLQAVLFLNSPGDDYGGGEFVITEQRPRAQSKATVIQCNKGDILIFTTNFRPVKGNQRYYKAAMKHGVSEVLYGQRHTLGIIFHDAA